MIAVKDAHKKLGQFAIRGVSLEVREQEYFVVLGPTGAGKTVLLECIAGLHPLDRGEIFINGRNVTHLPPEARNVSYVPQDYVLFPHLTVYENIAFGLRLRRWPDAEVRRRVEELAEMLGISHLLDRRPRTLSGGEQQRTALARALAPRPTALLLDEPLSALDESTRRQIADELSALPEKFGTTVIHVCHNFEEALALAHRIAVIHEGRIVQVGEPEEVFARPNCRFVADFMRVRNVLPVKAVQAQESGPLLTVAEGFCLKAASLPAAASSSPLAVAIRPESITVSARELQGPNVYRGRIVARHILGSDVELDIEAAGVPLVALVTRQVYRRLGLQPGDEAWIAIDPEDVHAFPDTPLPETAIKPGPARPESH